MTRNGSESPGHTGRVALVTGGGGFLGRAIADLLLQRGWRVRSYSRGDYPQLAASGVEVFRGDLCDAERLGRAVLGATTVFHVAARAGVGGQYREYHEANVVGTENVVAACQNSGVPFLIYTSSPSVVFAGRNIEGLDESIPYPAKHQSAYSATKAIAEQRVLAANSERLRTVALRPHLIWGPGDNHIAPRVIARARSGRLRIVGDGTNRVDITYVDNAAAAHLAAADALQNRPVIAAGKAYFISDGVPVNAWDFINEILACAGVPPVTRRISLPAARRIGAVLEFVYRALRIRGEPPMTRFLAEELATSHWFDISAARRDLGYSPVVDRAAGLARLRASLRRCRR